MKKNIKKIIIAFLGLVLFFTGSSVLASGPFNGQSGDCPSMGIGVYPNNIQRDSYGCWTATNVSANAGDTVNVSLWYHNNTSSTLTNVKASLSQSSTGPATNYTFSGNMYSSQGNTPLGSVSLNLSSSQTLTYQSAHWMADKQAIDNDIDTALLNMGNGVQANLGSVPPGWNDYGQIIVVFKVGNTNNNLTNCTISNFTANGSTSTSINQGNSVNLNWNTNGCTSAEISYVGSVNTSGSTTVYPNSNRTYVLTAYGSSGSSQTRSVYVDVNNNNYNDDNCEIEEFTINNSTSTVYVDEGDDVNIVWETRDCSSVEVEGPDFDSNHKNGDEDFEVERSGTYRIRAYDSDGSYETESIRVRIDENDDDQCKIIDFYSSSTSVNSGQAVTVIWDTENCDYVTISNIGSHLPPSYSRVIYPTSTKTYDLKAYGEGNDPEEDLRIFVNNYIPPTIVTPVYNSCAVTTLATNVGTSSATLNGLVNGSSSNTYFQYGTTVSMNSRTTSRSLNSGSNFSETISGLSPNTIYFYRLVSDCGGGTSYGSIEIFRTNKIATNSVVTTTVVQGTTVVGTSSPIMLKIENRYKSIRVRDDIFYTITYKNIGSKKLSNSLLQVVLPDGITFIRASDGTYVRNEKTLSLDLGDLDAGESGIVYLDARVDSLSRENAQIVTTALLIYTSPKGAQENAIAYVLNNPDFGNNNLTASAFFAGGCGMNLIGWLLLIIVILLIILIVRRYFLHRN